MTPRYVFFWNPPADPPSLVPFGFFRRASDPNRAPSPRPPSLACAPLSSFRFFQARVLSFFHHTYTHGVSYPRTGLRYRLFDGPCRFFFLNSPILQGPSVPPFGAAAENFLPVNPTPLFSSFCAGGHSFLRLSRIGCRTLTSRASPSLPIFSSKYPSVQ